MDGQYHPADFMMHSSDSLLRAAKKIDAPQMECGLKIVVSIPAEVMASLTHQRNVSGGRHMRRFQREK